MLRDDWYNLHKNGTPGADSNPSFHKKWNNWWYYNKWYVVIAVVAIAMVIDLGRSIWVNRMNEPDLQIAYLGAMLPDDTVVQLEQAFAVLAPDTNKDGKVIVTVNQYNLYGDSSGSTAFAENPAINIAAQTKLTVDLQSGTSFMFLMPDPETFQQDSHVLSRIDGTPLADTPDSDLPLYLSWKDCPVLAGMDIGSLCAPALGESGEIPNQSLFENLYVGRRYVDAEKNPEFAQACDEFWNKLLAGAKRN